MHTRHADRFGRVDLDDSRVSVRAADRLAPEHSRGLEIARVGELAGDLRHGVGATTRRLGAASAQRPRRRAHRPAATCTASRIFWYPVQRQRLPESASRISSSDGSGTRRRRSAAATTKPGVQKPHCTAPASANASCTGWSAVVPSEALDGDDVVPVGLRRENEARAHELAVEEHRARAALPLLAGVLRAGKLEPVA